MCVLTKVTWLEELAPGDSFSLDGLGGFMIDLKWENKIPYFTLILLSFGVVSRKRLTYMDE